MSKLKKEKKILEDNIKEEENIVKNNESRVGADGKTYGPEHYKEAMEHDKEDLKRVEAKLEKKKKINELKKASEAASKNIKEAVDESTTNQKLNAANPVLSKGSLRNPTELKEALKKKKGLPDLTGRNID